MADATSTTGADILPETPNTGSTRYQVKLAGVYLRRPQVCG